MPAQNLSSYVIRDAMLHLLSDDEASVVANAEGETHLADGDEYIDLGDIGHGVQIAQASGPVMGRVLPRKAVQAATWTKVLAQVATVMKG